MSKLKLINFLAAMVLAMVVMTADAKVWSADDVPMVHLRDKTKYVCDPESLMSSALRDSADFYLRKLHTECGVQTVFVVVNNVVNADCFRMAQDIGNKYGVGTSKERRGLVVVLAVDDRRYFLAPGKGLEGDLTDIECNDIARVCIVGNMRENKREMAVLATSKAIYNKLKTGKTGVKRIDEQENVNGEDWFALIFLLLVIFGMPLMMLICHILETFGIIKKSPTTSRRHRRNDDDDWIPPFIFGGGGGFRHSGGGGSFGGGSFGGGGAGGGW